MSLSVARGSSSVVGGQALPRDLPARANGPNEAVLRGLVGKGHGLDALSTFLRADREEVLDWVSRLGLPTPHDRSMRRSSGPKAWYAADYFRFIEYWVDGWHAASIGDQFSRSPGAVWSKARWLGLPRRDRRSVFRATAETVAPIDTAVVVPVEPERLVATATGAHLPIRRILKRGHVFWTPELDAELANRYWANQHYEAIAAEWGMSARTIASRACRLELPRRVRGKLVDHYDPTVIAANIAAARYVHRNCLAVSGWKFWAKRNGPRTSKRGQKLRERSGAGYGFGFSHSVGGSSYCFGL